MRNWLNPLVAILLLTPLILGNGECNAFIGTADKTGDDALMYSAQKSIDKGDYDAALTDIALLSTTKRNSHDGRVIEATAYAGKCSLNFVRMAKAIADDISSKKLMEILLDEMKAKTSYADCATAESKMTGVASAEMTTNDYLFLAFVEFAKIGAILAADSAADANDDGTVDTGTFDSCTDLSDTEANEIGTAINIAINSISSSGVAVGGTMTTTISNLCDTIEAVPPGDKSPCGITSTSGFTDDHRKAIRTLVKSNEIGLNTCGGAAYSSVPCSCL